MVRRPVRDGTAAPGFPAGYGLLHLLEQPRVVAALQRDLVVALHAVEVQHALLDCLARGWEGVQLLGHVGEWRALHAVVTRSQQLRRPHPIERLRERHFAVPIHVHHCSHAHTKVSAAPHPWPCPHTPGYVPLNILRMVAMGHFLPNILTQKSSNSGGFKNELPADARMDKAHINALTQAATTTCGTSAPLRSNWSNVLWATAFAMEIARLLVLGSSMMLKKARRNRSKSICNHSRREFMRRAVCYQLAAAPSPCRSSATSQQWSGRP